LLLFLIFHERKYTLALGKSYPWLITPVIRNGLPLVLEGLRTHLCCWLNQGLWCIL